ncbi:hypothetical protein PPROV_000240200 [Pycnococcus provasolii]|uniref:Uncharacterized protein n=1 Tax=Pycnococcus provasolii TaxID=41880 RepID=A0A830HEW3_9CHLO|nr:hypothetical protein PPROV_000240200 [Pycnococcus provasolii]
METTLKALLDRISTPAPSSLALEYAYEPEEEQQEMMEAVVKSMEGLSPSLGGFILRMSDEERNATMSAIEEALISGDDTSTKAVISHIPFAVLVVAAVVAAAALIAGVTCALVRAKKQSSAEIVHMRAPSVGGNSSVDFSTTTSSHARANLSPTPSSTSEAANFRLIAAKTKTKQGSHTTTSSSPEGHHHHMYQSSAAYATALSMTAALSSLAFAAREKVSRRGTAPASTTRSSSQQGEGRRDRHGIPCPGIAVVEHHTVAIVSSSRPPLGTLPEDAQERAGGGGEGRDQLPSALMVPRRRSAQVHVRRVSWQSPRETALL